MAEGAGSHYRRNESAVACHCLLQEYDAGRQSVCDVKAKTKSRRCADTSTLYSNQFPAPVHHLHRLMMMTALN